MNRFGNSVSDWELRVVAISHTASCFRHEWNLLIFISEFVRISVSTLHLVLISYSRAVGPVPWRHLREGHIVMMLTNVQTTTTTTTAAVHL